MSEELEHDQELPEELQPGDYEEAAPVAGSGYAGQLSGLSITPPEGLAVPDHVWPLVDAWPTYPRDEYGAADADEEPSVIAVHQACGQCHQSVRPISKGGHAYFHSDEQIRGLKLAHLVQAHDWTREGPADAEASPDA